MYICTMWAITHPMWPESSKLTSFQGTLYIKELSLEARAFPGSSSSPYQPSATYCGYLQNTHLNKVLLKGQNTHHVGQKTPQGIEGGSAETPQGIEGGSAEPPQGIEGGSAETPQGIEGGEC